MATNLKAETNNVIFAPSFFPVIKYLCALLSYESVYVLYDVISALLIKYIWFTPYPFNKYRNAKEKQHLLIGVVLTNVLSAFI